MDSGFAKLLPLTYAYAISGLISSAGNADKIAVTEI
jgi:hypothetical protein